MENDFTIHEVKMGLKAVYILSCEKIQTIFHSLMEANST